MPQWTLLRQGDWKGTMKRILLLTLLLPLLGWAANIETYQAANQSSVRVYTQDGHGTGVVLTDHCILTAQHVVEKAAFIKAETIDGTFVPLLVQKQSKDLDLAVLCTRQDLKQKVKLAAHEPQQYEEVFVIGYPLAAEQFLTEGRWQKDGFISAECAPGNSGGGVFNSAGQLVGIVDAIAAYGKNVFPHLCLVIPIGTVTTWLGDDYVGKT